jgi:hypothetical protein
MADIDFLTLTGIILMSSVHLWGSRIAQLETVKSRGWVSFSAGASVAYVFVHVFPEIGIFQQQMLGHAGGHGQAVPFFNQPLYLAALAGLCLMFLLNSIDSRFSEEDSMIVSQQHKHYMKLFWTRAVLYGLYNLMVAYIITRRHGEGYLNTLLIAVGLMFHFLVVNIRFSEMYIEFFQKYVRWLAVTGLFLGWIFGVAVKLSDGIISTTFAVIGGMVTYVALKSELSETENQAPYYFLAGVIVYSLIILAIPFFGSSGNAVH